MVLRKILTVLLFQINKWNHWPRKRPRILIEPYGKHSSHGHSTWQLNPKSISNRHDINKVTRHGTSWPPCSLIITHHPLLLRCPLRRRRTAAVCYRVPSPSALRTRWISCLPTSKTETSWSSASLTSCSARRTAREATRARCVSSAPL